VITGSKEMPPKPRFTKEDVVDAAFSIVREHGWGALSQRSIAKKLNASIGPIYSHLKSMRNLEDEVMKKAYELVHEYMATPRTGDKALDQGVGYVMFAKEEKKLFRGFFDERLVPIRRKYSLRLYKSMDEALFDHPHYEGLSRKQIEEYRKKILLFGYGLAVFINTSFLETVTSEEEIIEIIRETAEMLSIGFRETLKKNREKKMTAQESEGRSENES
jgi:AcrR family transcriptional regulator